LRIDKKSRGDLLRFRDLGGRGPPPMLEGPAPELLAAAYAKVTLMTRVLVLNGPNLGRLGSREPEVYWQRQLCRPGGAVHGVRADLGLEVEVRQTDDEAELVGWLHEAADTATPGAQPRRVHALLLCAA